MKNKPKYWILLLGVISILSSILSVNPADNYHYRKLQVREAIEPGSVTSDEWISTEMSVAVVLLMVGIPAFLVTTFFALVLAACVERLRPVSLILGITWICLGGALHGLVWFSE